MAWFDFLSLFFTTRKRSSRRKYHHDLRTSGPINTDTPTSSPIVAFSGHTGHTGHRSNPGHTAMSDLNDPPVRITTRKQLTSEIEIRTTLIHTPSQAPTTRVPQEMIQEISKRMAAPISDLGQSDKVDKVDKVLSAAQSSEISSESIPENKPRHRFRRAAK